MQDAVVAVDSAGRRRRRRRLRLAVHRAGPSRRRRRSCCNVRIIRNVTRPLLIGRTCRMMGLLLHSGVPLLEGLRLCQQAIGNRVYKDLLDDLADSVVNGRGMAGPLSEAEIVPVSAREMIVTAERTGNLAEVSQMLGSYYEEEAETRMRSGRPLLGAADHRRHGRRRGGRRAVGDAADLRPVVVLAKRGPAN